MKFLIRAQQLDKLKKTDEAIDILFNDIDKLLTAGFFKAADRIIDSPILDDLSPDLLVALLTITLAAKIHLPSRKKLFEKTKQKMQEDIARTLQGLE
jgi:hypothetical protein